MAHSDVRRTGDQEVAGSIPAGSGNILSWSDMFLVLRCWIKEAMYSYAYFIVKTIFFLFLFFYFIFSSPEQKLRVSYCHHPMSVVRRPSFVVNN